MTQNPSRVRIQRCDEPDDGTAQLPVPANVYREVLEFLAKGYDGQVTLHIHNGNIQRHCDIFTRVRPESKRT